MIWRAASRIVWVSRRFWMVHKRRGLQPLIDLAGGPLPRDWAKVGRVSDLALQLLFAASSESMGHHDSVSDDWWRVS
jgi:hypothetical protein